MKQEEKGNLPRKSKSTKSLKDKIHKHISDKNDVITDDDLKNIQVGEDSFEKEAGAIDALPDEIDKGSKELSDSVAKKKLTSTWDVINEEDTP